jgi:hypothetical protein
MSPKGDEEFGPHGPTLRRFSCPGVDRYGNVRPATPPDRLTICWTIEAEWVPRPSRLGLSSMPQSKRLPITCPQCLQLTGDYQKAINNVEYYCCSDCCYVWTADKSGDNPQRVLTTDRRT